MVTPPRGEKENKNMSMMPLFQDDFPLKSVGLQLNFKTFGTEERDLDATDGAFSMGILQKRLWLNIEPKNGPRRADERRSAHTDLYKLYSTRWSERIYKKD